MKHTKNFEIIYLIYYILRRKLRKVNQFLNEKENQRIKECNDKYNKLLYELIDYNDTNLINKILEQFDIPSNDEKEDETGQIEFEKYFILILCLYKRDETIVQKLYEIYKKNNYNLYKINKTYRSYFSLILVEFMYLIPKNEKILIYKSITQYYEEMYYYFYYFDKENFENSLNNLNKGISDEIYDYYFEKYDIIYNEELLKIDSNIVDYFVKYIKKMYQKEKKDEIKFEDYLYDISLKMNYSINDEKFNKIYNCYSSFISKNFHSLDLNKLWKHCKENYLDIKENDKIDNIKNFLLLK